LIKIHVINGDSKDALSYKDNEGKEYNVIAIGGDKLSRGLTLEGLSISYFVRESKMYDTLMQMGRWFGFRPRYADLCRVYIPDNINNWFNRIAFATDDLREQIIYMCEEGANPKEFGLRVATHPELKISNAKKVQIGVEQKLDFSNILTQTRDIDIDGEQYNCNFEVTEKFLLAAGNPINATEHFLKLGRENKKKSNHYFWEKVPGNLVASYLEEYRTSKHANKVNSLNISKYIREQLKFWGLINWTVCLINTGKNIENNFDMATLDVGAGITRREGNGNCNKIGDVCSLKTLTSEGHEYFDFTQEQIDKVKKIRDLKEKGNEASTAQYVRAKIRERKNGLLIIYPIDYKDKECATSMFDIPDVEHKQPLGLAIVFPHNKGEGSLVSYKLNSVAIRSEVDELFD